MEGYWGGTREPEKAILARRVYPRLHMRTLEGFSNRSGALSESVLQASHINGESTTRHFRRR